LAAFSILANVFLLARLSREEALTILVRRTPYPIAPEGTVTVLAASPAITPEPKTDSTPPAHQPESEDAEVLTATE